MDLFHCAQVGFGLTRQNWEGEINMPKYKVDNAIILAAGMGSRFIPITFEMPKGLVKVHGKPLLERQIEQVKAAGINEIIVVTGYMREKYEYLKDKYSDIKLVYNKEYTTKNNLSSLYHARRFLKNSYILSSDNWLRNNMFKAYEDDSWYSCIYKCGETSEWCVSTDNTGRINNVTIGGKDSWVMYGPVFICEAFSVPFKEKLYQYFHQYNTEKYMWENVFIDEINDFDLYINKQDGNDVLEFENIEELRVFDPKYGYATGNKCLKIISEVFNTEEKNITNIELSKAGMTNNSFSFSINGTSYILRYPGEGSNKLIDRKNEKIVYEVIKPINISDDNIYFDSETGIKISTYYTGSRNTDPHNNSDITDSLSILRAVHSSGKKTKKAFSINMEIRRYIHLIMKVNNIKYLLNTIMYSKWVRIFQILRKMSAPKVLCHIDCNPDNFIRLPNGIVKLIDWEYAGMADPIIDVSMYAIYSYYKKSEADQLLRQYLQHDPSKEERIRFYAYMSLGGFLWMLWTEYKQFFGIEFGEYGLKMRQYAEVYYDYTLSLYRTMKKEQQKNEKQEN
jgi:CTP:phosphocholine cytidylyltransferase-like protein/thiamine kinase-like enzyme